ncbi:LTA synthase family protein [Calidifontibacillus erzurumensis]|uniref:LTA synthase family protein n=1 Tax=Calidifontibacillus erzurumensis TaxID=2741433 RepID=A0A8J8GG92_9BACI|nr:LTA synthase family protein [Calidifontibacillus erzurumensis]NSL52934.1 LTA synthase family protein [Calidifontibacillus erzurumensis]
MKGLSAVVKNLRPSREEKFLFLAMIFLWLKSYIVSRLLFDLPIENMLQEFILLLNPIGPVILLFLFAYAFRRKLSIRGILISSFLFTFLSYANAVYYRFFNDFITIPVLFQVKNFGDLGGSALELMQPLDVLFFVDLVLLAVIARKKDIKLVTFKKPLKRGMILAAVALLVFNVLLAETQRPQLLTRTFDREMLVKYLGVYNYHLYDLFMHSKASAQRAFAEGSDIIEVENYVNDGVDEPNEMTGIAKGKNVILISMESLQSWVLNYEVEGQPVTPFLNELIKDSFYFENFYHQTGQGKTSDAEFLIDNSLYPLPSGAVFTTNAQNEFYALPEILRNNGYTTASFHGNNKSFWNRDLMYKSLGYDHFFDETYFNVTDDNSVNYGLKDIPFFEQSIPLLKSLPQPFHAKFITLTNHFPYILDKEEDVMIPRLTTGDGSVDRYVQTVRYLDESLKIFFDLLKQNGIYENSIIVLYGDHYGISKNHNKAMSQVIGKEITPDLHVELQKVPFIIHVPGMEGKKMKTIGGQIDVKPTLLNLLGIDPGNDISFGEDLFSETRKDFVIFRDGSFVTKEFIYTEGTCYSKANGSVIDPIFCEKSSEEVGYELALSDKVIQRDLLRFLNQSPVE